MNRVGLFGERAFRFEALTSYMHAVLDLRVSTVIALVLDRIESPR